MCASYRSEFIADRGFRLFRNDQSLLIGLLALHKAFTDDERAALYRAWSGYADGLSNNAPLPSSTQAPLRAKDFPDLTAEPFYKYVSDQTWLRLREGSIQLGTAEYYRNTPNMKIRDVREGASMFHLAWGDSELSAAMLSGFNCALFCGTSIVGDKASMGSKFGSKLIRIDKIDEFADMISNLIDARRARVYDIIYTDVKNYAEEVPGVDHLRELTGGGNMDPNAVNLINEEFHDLFYEYSFLPSMFAKPAAYNDEHERRLVFELTSDLQSPTLIVKDKALAALITLVEDL